MSYYVPFVLSQSVVAVRVGGFGRAFIKFAIGKLEVW